MKKIILLVVFCSFMFARASYYASLPYIGYLQYEGATPKKEGYIEGAYLAVTKFPWKAEFDVEALNITYNDRTPDLTQGDFSMFLTYYYGYDLAYKFGIHYIDSTDQLTDGGKIFKVGILYYKQFKWNRGIDVYYSDYSNLSTSPKLIQVSPKVGFNFGNYNSTFGSFYTELKADYIKILENQEENSLNSSYSSIDLTLTNYNGNFTTTLNGWVGKRAYAVENGGFVVNNIGDEQTGGFKVSEEYKFNKAQSLKFEYVYTKFKEDGDANSRTYLLSFNYGF